jgi:hypothetical protein
MAVMARQVGPWFLKDYDVPVETFDAGLLLERCNRASPEILDDTWEGKQRNFRCRCWECAVDRSAVKNGE